MALNPVEAQYTQGDLRDRILEALVDAGKDPEHPALEDLAPFDQFHTLGVLATTALADAAGLAEGDEVLDVGCGIGGPARTLAISYGCRVTGIDITPELCEVAEDLNARVGLSDRITIRHGDALALPFEDGSFDVVWTQHVSMNIADKAALYREFARVLRPGGRLAFFDIIAGNDPPHFPVPWADDASISHLVAEDEVGRLLEEAGFQVTHWEDTTQAGAEFFEKLVEGPPASSPLGPHLLIPNLPSKMRNLTQNLKQGRVRVLRGVSRLNYGGF
ncbi:MAG: class I SAM-dependent methyltransferase [Actinomycetota bacterium]